MVPLWQCFSKHGPKFEKSSCSELKLRRYKRHMTTRLLVFKMMFGSSLAEKQGPADTERTQWSFFQFFKHQSIFVPIPKHSQEYTMTITYHNSRDSSSCFKSVTNIPHWHTKWPDGRLTHQASLPQSQHGGQHPTTQPHTWTVAHLQETYNNVPHDSNSLY